MTTPRVSKGFALAVALFMLVLLTLIGVTAMKLTATHSRIVGNLQVATEQEMAARAAIETYVTDHPALACEVTPISVCIQQRQVCVSVCTKCIGRGVRNPEGGSISGGKPLYDSYWDISATTEPETLGAEVTIHWGLMIPLSGFCPQEGEGECPICPLGEPVLCPAITCP